MLGFVGVASSPAGATNPPDASGLAADLEASPMRLLTPWRVRPIVEANGDALGGTELHEHDCTGRSHGTDAVRATRWN
jgi:hypothetical protein